MTVECPAPLDQQDRHPTSLSTKSGSAVVRSQSAPELLVDGPIGRGHLRDVVQVFRGDRQAAELRGKPDPRQLAFELRL